MIKQILVPLDGSKFAETALNPALDIARRAGGTVHLVAVQEPVPTWMYPGVVSIQAEWRLPYFDDLLARLDQDPVETPSITTATPTGQVHEELEYEAARVHADLVVMATHGRGALSRTWLGSQADAFVRHTRRPVLMVRPLEKAPPEMVWEGARRILVPLDGSELAEAALIPALQLGHLYEASYHLVRVVHFPIGPGGAYLPDAADFNEELVQAGETAATEYLASVRQRLADRGVSVDDSVLVAPQTARGILAAATESRCDVIAMATHGGRLRRIALGSSADKVLRSADVPLLLVRPAGEEGDRSVS